MRLDKFLSLNGFGSRKEVRNFIKKKQVMVNLQVITDAGFILNLSQDKVMFNDQPVQYSEHLYIMINKPAGYICEHHPVEYPSVLDLLETQRNDLIFVGRLDADTEGLLLITNDGQFSHQVAHGKKDITKTYEVHLESAFDTNFIKQLESGITLDDGPIKPATVKMISPSIIHLTISEGKYHQVKRMMHYCKNQVVYLKRIRIGQLDLDSTLSLGASKELTEAEISTLLPTYRQTL